jgi:hypothetical protein
MNVHGDNVGPGALNRFQGILAVEGGSYNPNSRVCVQHLRQELCDCG